MPKSMPTSCLPVSFRSSSRATARSPIPAKGGCTSETRPRYYCVTNETIRCRIVFMGSRLSAPGPQEKRFAAYMDGLANAAGHADRHAPLKSYCTGCCFRGSARASSRWRRAWLRTMFAARIKRCITWWPTRRGTTRQCWLRCGGRCCQPCRNTVLWWHGLWMTPDFRSRGSIL